MYRPLLGALLGALLFALPAPALATTDLGSLPLRATYEVDAQLNYETRHVAVATTAAIENVTEAPYKRLRFNLATLRVGGALIKEVAVGSKAAAWSVAGQTLTVELGGTLGPGEQVDVSIRYTARLKTDARDKNWLFAKLNGIVSAYRWIPWLSRPVKFKRPNGADPFVTNSTPRVRVTITSDRKLMYATSGRRTDVSKDGLSQTFVANDVRDFNFAAAPNYKLRTSTLNGTTISLFYRELPPRKTMRWARRALEFYGNKIGPYPWPTLTIAETGGGFGMESPAHFWVTRTTSSTRIPYVVVHEAAHQWFYGAIGNDQTVEPFADEAVAEFLSAAVLSASLRSGCAKDTLDRSIWEYSSRCYYHVIYVQGGKYLAQYRQRVGDAAFWAGMRAYYEAHRFDFGGTRQLLDALDAAAGAASSAHYARFPRYYVAE